MKIFTYLLSFFVYGSVTASSALAAQLNVITTTTDAASLVKVIGGESVKVESLTKGSQDPHYVEAKPSFMLKVTDADLLVSMGMQLEIAWLPAVLRGARNKNIVQGAPGSLVLGDHIEAPLGVPQGAVSREDGDVHPEGNPHFLLDPVRAGELGLKVAEKLGSLDPVHAKDYLTRAQAFQTRLQAALPGWRKRIEDAKINETVTYHKTLTYFLDRFGVTVVDSIEPKPGVPPTAGHTLRLIKTVAARKIPVLLIEHFFEEAPARRIQQSVPGVRVTTIPVSVDAGPGTSDLEQLYGTMVSKIAGEGHGT